MARTFTEEERKILRIVQADLPDSLTPYADIAKEVGGVSEETVMNLLRELKEEGVIRRFGASIKHQRAGWASNAMVGWRVRGLDVESLGKTASQNPRVSHCYYRPSSVEDWPYELYTMVHGHSDEECQQVIGDLARSMGTDDYIVLKSIRELKKISPTYF